MERSFVYVISLTAEATYVIALGKICRDERRVKNTCSNMLYQTSMSRVNSPANTADCTQVSSTTWALA